MVIKASILADYKQNLKIIIETNLSDYITGGILSQLDKDRLLYLIIFFSKNLNLDECNYTINNKKLLAIIYYFEQ